MNHKPLVRVLSLTLSICIYALGTSSALSISSLSLAATEKPEQAKKPRRTKRSATMRPAIYKRLEAVRVLVEEEKYSKALDKLKALEKVKRNAYEKAQTFNMFAYVYFNQEKYAAAAQAYEQTLKTENLPDSLAQTAQYSLAKLYLIEEDYQRSLNALNAWFNLVEKPGAEAHILKAQLLYQLERYNQALTEVKKAITIIEAKGQKPKESWLLIERAVYYANKDFKGMERCLQDLIAHYPKAQYWVQLSAVYNELGKSGKELSVMETAYDQNMLTKESQIVSLAYAFLGQEIPYKSAQVMIKGMKDGLVEENAKNLSLLADALMLAKEYDAAIDVMSKAAKASQKGKDFFKLAQIHTERQEWNLALKNVSKALVLGELKDEGGAYILKGLILFNMKRLNSAQKEFKLAAKIDGHESVAKQWLRYIDSEQKRLAYMASVE
ncbi:MAG: hypothetical protein HRU21_11995 [Pseudomonadales bacterium]|nr:hypothetical protein [Pseudomonadales bacterium]